jgi:hypothetical protein
MEHKKFPVLWMCFPMFAEKSFALPLGSPHIDGVPVLTQHFSTTTDVDFESISQVTPREILTVALEFLLTLLTIVDSSPTTSFGIWIKNCNSCHSWRSRKTIWFEWRYFTSTSSSCSTIGFYDSSRIDLNYSNFWFCTSRRSWLTHWIISNNLLGWSSCRIRSNIKSFAFVIETRSIEYYRTLGKSIDYRCKNSWRDCTTSNFDSDEDCALFWLKHLSMIAHFFQIQTHSSQTEGFCEWPKSQNCRLCFCLQVSVSRLKSTLKAFHCAGKIVFWSHYASPFQTYRHQIGDSCKDSTEAMFLTP